MIEYLQISLSEGRFVDARLMQRAGRELAIRLPGLNYNCDMPLLYYATEHLYERDVDTLRVDFAYNRDETFLAETDENRLERLKADGRAVIDYGVQLGEYDRITIIGKSLGTISMGWANPIDKPVRMVWLTPSIGGTGLRAQMVNCKHPSFCLIGRKDRVFSDALIKELTTAGIDVTTVKGADHGFSHADGTADSVRVVLEAVEALTNWLDAT